MKITGWEKTKRIPKNLSQFLKLLPVNKARNSFFSSLPLVVAIVVVVEIVSVVDNDNDSRFADNDKELGSSQMIG